MRFAGALLSASLIVASLMSGAGCESREEGTERRKLNAWLDVVERAAAGSLDEASPVPYYCADYERKAERFRKISELREKADRFAKACAHDAPVAWLRDDLSRHPTGEPLCAIDRLALRNLPEAARQRERALADEVERRCAAATAGSPAPPSAGP